MDKIETLKMEAEKSRQQSIESFDRCDTDGFLSQWANDMESQELLLQAQIESNNGLYEFPALFDLNGNRVRAKLGKHYNKFS